ncbi:hypothetical protein B0H14DRAFT_2609643 [Mycena olivaceomarginata]|nr:hypothetical protein B0H14DRAFT_2609643 [Mycena olivaceomarginata]
MPPRIVNRASVLDNKPKIQPARRDWISACLGTSGMQWFSVLNSVRVQTMHYSAGPNLTAVCIQEFYRIPNSTISGSKTNSIGVTGYNSVLGDEYANNPDLATFLNEFRPDIAGNTFNLALLNGAENLQDNSGGLEGQIDIQYTVGVAENVPVAYVLDQRKLQSARGMINGNSNGPNLDGGTRIRQVVQSRTKPHAAFVHCAKPHAAPALKAVGVDSGIRWKDSTSFS